MSDWPPPPGYVRVSVDVPANVARAVAENGSAFVSFVEAWVQAIRLEEVRESWRQNREKAEERILWFARIGRQGYREVRRELRACGCAERRAGAADVKARAIPIIAAGLNVNPEALSLAIKQHRNRLWKRVWARRNREILRLVIAGYSLKEIAQRHRLALHSAKNLVADLRREARLRGLSEAGLLEAMRPAAPTKSAIPATNAPEETGTAVVIPWNVARRAGGGR